MAGKKYCKISHVVMVITSENIEFITLSIFFCFQSNLDQTWSDCSTHVCYNLTKFGQDWTENKKKIL